MTMTKTATMTNTSVKGHDSTQGQQQSVKIKQVLLATATEYQVYERRPGHTRSTLHRHSNPPDCQPDVLTTLREAVASPCNAFSNFQDNVKRTINYIASHFTRRNDLVSNYQTRNVSRRTCRMFTCQPILGVQQTTLPVQKFTEQNLSNISILETVMVHTRRNKYVIVKLRSRKSLFMTEMNLRS